VHCANGFIVIIPLGRCHRPDKHLRADGAHALRIKASILPNACTVCSTISLALEDRDRSALMPRTLASGLVPRTSDLVASKSDEDEE
jgi:hypothetical protein